MKYDVTIWQAPDTKSIFASATVGDDNGKDTFTGYGLKVEEAVDMLIDEILRNGRN